MKPLRRHHLPDNAMHLPSNRPSAESADKPVSPVKALIRERRKIALTYLRSQSDADRRRLEDLDHELAGYNIDIPAVQHRVAQRKN